MKRIYLISNCCISGIYFELLCGFAALRENVFNIFTPPYPQLIPKSCISRVDFDLPGAFARKGFSPVHSVYSVPSVASF